MIIDILVEATQPLKIFVITSKLFLTILEYPFDSAFFIGIQHFKIFKKNLNNRNEEEMEATPRPKRNISTFLVFRIWDKLNFFEKRSKDSLAMVDRKHIVRKRRAMTYNFKLTLRFPNLFCLWRRFRNCFLYSSIPWYPSWSQQEPSLCSEYL